MPVIQSQVDPQSQSFQREREQMLALIHHFRDYEDRVRNTSNSQEAKFRARKQLLPRERIALLLDRGSEWLEFSTLAGLRMHDDDGDKNVLGGGIITGIGRVSGVRCVVIASDSAIKGGTITPMGMRKGLRAEASRWKTSCPSSVSSNRAAPTSCTWARSSSRAGAALPTRHACRPQAFRRSA